MRKIIIGFSKTEHIMSKAIMCLEDTDFSHVYFNFYSDTLKRDIIYHASFHHGVSFINKQRFLETSKIIHEFELNLTDEEYIEFMQYMIDKSSIKYGKIQILGMALSRILSKLDIKFKNPIKDGSLTEVCSELVGEYLKKKGLIDKSVDFEQEGPGYIYNALKNKR
jgi:hypothetical protein